MSGSDLGCQALSSRVTLGGSLTRLEPCPVKGEIASSLHSASGSEAVLTCRLLWVPLQFPSLSQLGRRGDLAVKKTVSCIALKVIATVRFICIFN